jgi:hypothetical protein
LLDEFKIPTPAFRNISQKNADNVEESKDGEPSSKPDCVDLSEFPDDLPLGLEERVEEAISGQRAEQKRVRRAPLGAKTSKSLQALEQVPKIHILIKPSDIDEKSIKGKAASYYKESQEIFVNGLYPAVDRMASELEAAMAGQGDAEERREIILTASRKSMAFRVGKAVCYAISKRLVEEWNGDDLDKATSPESLSLMADDFRQGMQETKRYVLQQLRVQEVKNMNAESANLNSAA